MTDLITEKLNDDDYYLVHRASKKVLKHLGKESVPMFSNPSDHPRLKQHITSPDHTVMSGMKARMGGYVAESAVERALKKAKLLT